jgi:putative hydrolase of the HAD superfamily
VALRRVIRAVLLDAHGTLLELEPPAPALARRLGVAEPVAHEAFLAEVAYYRAHLMEGRDLGSVDALRVRCASVLREALVRGGVAQARLPVGEAMTAALLESLVFRAYPEVLSVLGALRAGGIRLVVASNWDASLPGTLSRVGVLELVDGVVTSAEVGEAKPGGAVFRAALALAGAAPQEALHVGDRVDEDVAGARAAGVKPVLVARGGGRVAAGGGVRVVASLAELPGLVFGGGLGAAGTP